MPGALGDYRCQSFYAAAVLRSIASQTKRDAMIGASATRALTDEECKRLRKVSKLVNEARQLLELEV